MLKQLTTIALRAGEILRSARNTEICAEEKSGPRDLVTKYDTMVQQFLEKELLAVVPDAGFLGEEGTKQADWSSYRRLFIVDPIDGTTNFVQGFHNCCVSVGLMVDGQMEYGVVCAPFDDELFSAQRGRGAFLNGRPIRSADKDLSHSLLILGSAIYYKELTARTLGILNAAFPLVQDIRRFGSAALDLCYLAAGRAGVFYETRLCPWDYAAGSLIAREAGCEVTAMDGSPLNYCAKCSVLAGSPTAYRQLLGVIREGGYE